MTFVHQYWQYYDYKELKSLVVHICILLGKVRVTSQEARGALRVSAEPTIISSPGQDGGIEAGTYCAFFD